MRRWPVLEDLALAFGVHRLAATVEFGVAVPFGSGEVDDGAPATIDATNKARVGGFVPGRFAEVDRLEVFEDRLVIVLDGAEHVVGAVRGFILGVHRIH